jgi:protease-4
MLRRPMSSPPPSWSRSPSPVPVLALATLAAALAAAPAAAQVQEATDRRPPPTRGVLLPGVTVAGDAEPAAVETNPGQLGLLESAGSALALNYWGNDANRPGRGAGVFFGAPLVIPRLAAAGGLQWLRPTVPGEPRRYWKLQLGLGLRLGRALGVGASWERLARGPYAGLDSFTVGLGWHLHRRLAFGLAVRDLNRPTPRTDGPRLPREWNPELALRPFADDRLTVWAGSRVTRSEGRWSVLPHVRLAARLLPGAHLFVEGESPRYGLDVVPDGMTTARAFDYRATVGLTLALDRSSATLAGHGSVRLWEDAPPEAESPMAPGGTLLLRSFYTRRPAVYAAQHIARVRLSGLDDDVRFVQTLLRLTRMADDRHVGAVLLQLEGLDLGMGRLDELRGAIAALRARGKHVLAYVESPSTRDYYVAAAADRILMHPAGGLYVVGLSQSVTFFKGLLDSIGVNVDLVRIAEFKGAMEPFVQESSSDAVRANRDAMLDDVHARLVAALALDRRLPPEQVGKLLDQGLFSPPEAKRRGLVDELSDDKELETTARKLLGVTWSLRDADTGRREAGQWRPTRVAVLFVQGQIMEGKGGGSPFAVPQAMTWSERLIDALDRLRRDPAVGAIVLRVNSPGGSAFASDQIARAIKRVRQAGKPVVASMGDVAASGGYYIAAPTAAIFAAPSTTTGSIGIYSYKADGAGLLGRLGVNVEVWKRTANADLFSPYRPWSEDERQLVYGRLEHLYRVFLDVVADGRKDRGLTAERVDRVGRGRIWTGAQAREVGLVDDTGGLIAALHDAARRGGVPLGPGGLPEVQAVSPTPPDPLEALLALRRFVGAQDEADAPVPPAVAFAAELWKALERQGRGVARLIAPVLAGPGWGIEARLPYELEIR